jgi:DNA polymerase
MNEFDKALDLTTKSLRKLKETDSPLRGSREALRRLGAARAKPAAAPVAVSPATPATPTLEVFPTGGGTKAERMEQLRAAVQPCEKCPNLARTRTQTVFGVGNIDARIMFVGEAPGADEDLQGEPFVEKAGQLLTKIIETMGVKRGDVFIANVLKCRPDMPAGSTGNRRPSATEMVPAVPAGADRGDQAGGAGGAGIGRDGRAAGERGADGAIAGAVA